MVMPLFSWSWSGVFKKLIWNLFVRILERSFSDTFFFVWLNFPDVKVCKKVIRKFQTAGQQNQTEVRVKKCHPKDSGTCNANVKEIVVLFLAPNMTTFPSCHCSFLPTVRSSRTIPQNWKFSRKYRNCYPVEGRKFLSQLEWFASFQLFCFAQKYFVCFVLQSEGNISLPYKSLVFFFPPIDCHKKSSEFTIPIFQTTPVSNSWTNWIRLHKKKLALVFVPAVNFFPPSGCPMQRASSRQRALSFFLRAPPLNSLVKKNISTDRWLSLKWQL